jgi:pimeloyl-ACP methyl ester carboxylesterase
MHTVSASCAFAAPWGARGWVTECDVPVHWVEYPGPESAVPIVFVHGLGGSHLNWSLIAGALASDRRAVALDLRGFGLTPGNRHNASVFANTDLLDRFLRTVVGRPAILVGNSMGGLVSIVQAARHPETVAGLVLVDPALPSPRRRLPDRGVTFQFAAYAVPALGESYMRRLNATMTPEQHVQRMIRLCFADVSRADPQLLDASAALVRERQRVEHKEAAFLAAARSLMRMLVRPDQYRAMMRSIDVPVLLMSGDMDRLVPIEAARHAAVLNPHWDALFLPGVGHTPQLEVPDLTVDAIAEWLARIPAGASR